MLLIVHQCFLMMLSRTIIVRKATLQKTNKFLLLLLLLLLLLILLLLSLLLLLYKEIQSSRYSSRGNHTVSTIIDGSIIIVKLLFLIKFSVSLTSSSPKLLARMARAVLNEM